MSCCPFDLGDYFFGELGHSERGQVEAHLQSCMGCREELERLRGTQQALLRLKDEEIPRRIAFVSDKVFEPSRAARWWAALPKMALAAGLMLLVFLAGATWNSNRSEARVERAMQAMDARHEAEMRNAEQAFEQLDKEVKFLYRQSVDVRPAALRQ